MRQGACSKEEFQGHVKAYPLPMVKVVQFFPKKRKKMVNSGGAVVRFSILGFKTSNISIQILLSLQTLSPLYFLAPREVGLNISFPPYN